MGRNKGSSKIPLHTIVNVQLVTDNVCWHVKISLHRFDIRLWW